MNDVCERLKDIKHCPEDQIEKTISEIASELSENKNLEESAIFFFNKEALECKSKGEILFFTILLSFVLAGVAVQMSPDFRNSYIAQIKSICERKEINYNLVSRLTTCEKKLAELINMHCYD